MVDANDDISIQSNGQHICAECGRAYKYPESLKRHRKTHLKEHGHCCPSCGACFTRKDLLDRHSRIHSLSSSSTTGHKNACSECRRMRVRCDRLTPCTRCWQKDRTCIYPPKNVEAFDAASNATSETLLFDNAGMSKMSESDIDSLHAGLPDMLRPPPVPDLSGTATTTTLQSDSIIPSLAAELPSMPAYPPGFADTAASQESLIDAEDWDQIFNQDHPENDMDLDLSSTLRWKEESFVNELLQVCFAATTPDESLAMSHFWSASATRLQEIYGITSEGHRHAFEALIEAYWDRFHTPGQVLWREGTAVDALPPYLYLTLSAIGAVFTSRRGADFFQEVLAGLQNRLPEFAIRTNLPDEAMKPVCQTLVLTFAATLMFQCEDAFTAARRLGNITVLLAKKINLFDEPNQIGSTEMFDQNQLFMAFIDAEERRRLVYSLLKTQAILSIAIGDRPLLSHEEINTRLPVPAELWLAIGPDARNRLAQYFARCSAESETIFSDVVRFATDTDEQLPHLNQPEHLELIMHGLQTSVWQVSHDPTMAKRLYLHDDVADDMRSLHGDGNDSLRSLKRKMGDLRSQYRRVLTSLRKWQSSLIAAKLPSHSITHRTSIITSHVLCDISFAQMHSILPIIRREAVHTIDDRLPNRTALHMIHEWVDSAQSTAAVKHACSIYTTIQMEASRSPEQRATFTIHTHVVLLSAAMIVWAYAGLRTAVDVSSELPSIIAMDGNLIQLTRVNNAFLMQAFARLFAELMPSFAPITGHVLIVSGLAQKAIPLS